MLLFFVTLKQKVIVNGSGQMLMSAILASSATSSCSANSAFSLKPKAGICYIEKTKSSVLAGPLLLAPPGHGPPTLLASFLLKH